MEQFYFKTQDEQYHKLTVDYDQAAENPRKFDGFGNMVFLEQKKYRLGDQQVSNWKDFFIDQLSDEKKQANYENLTQAQLYQIWEKEQLIVFPLNIYEHSDIGINPATLHTEKETWLDGTPIEDITNSGFIYIPKNHENEQIHDYTKNHTEEQTKQWLEKNLGNEIDIYSKYINGDVYRVQHDVFDKTTLTWKENESYSDIYDYPVKLIEIEFGEVEYLTPREIQDLEETLTPEYIEKTGNDFFSEIKDCLSDFDGNLLYAQRAIFNSWKKQQSNDLFPSQNKLQALSIFLEKKGCTDPEKTISFLNETIEHKEFDPFSYQAEQEGYQTYLNVSTNPSSSNYKSRISANHALIVDSKNKRFGLLSGSYRFSGDRLPNYKDNKTLSAKQFKEKIQQLIDYGFHFEKFSGHKAQYAQGSIEQLLGNKKKTNEYTRGV